MIVGASLAGAKAAEGARDAGYEGRIVLVGDEPHLPYERPPLSKTVLRGEAEPDSARVHPIGYYGEHEIELVSDEITGIDPAGRRVRLAGGLQIPFDSLVLATGAAPRRLDILGADLDGVHYLRTLDDSLALREAIRDTARVVVIGAGWIGSEVAASARQMGVDVVLVDPGPAPLRRVVGDEVSEMFLRLHADHGVTLRMGSAVRELRGAGRVEQVVLADGRIEVADVVVVGVGVVPRVELAEAALGIRVDNGIVVDHHLESTVPGIYAAGDVANAWHPHYESYLRVEHWANALNQGFAAGRNAAGRTRALRTSALLLLRPIRARSRVRGSRVTRRRGRDSRRCRRACVHRVLAPGRRRDCRHVGEHLGCDRRPQGDRRERLAGGRPTADVGRRAARRAQSGVEAMIVARMCLHGPRSPRCFPHHGHVHRQLPSTRRTRYSLAPLVTTESLAPSSTSTAFDATS